MVGRAIYIARVEGKYTFQQYWDDPQFLMKRPFYGGSMSRAFGDNIYHNAADGTWLQEWSHHTYPDGGMNLLNLDRDTSSNNVLWSRDFVYFGRSAVFIPPDLRNVEGDDLYPSSRNYRNTYSAEMIAGVEAWFATLPRNRQGWPQAWK